MNGGQSLGTYLQRLDKVLGSSLIRVSQRVDSKFEACAILQHLENRGDFSAVLFDNMTNLNGEPGHRAAINLMADRRRLAIALGLEPSNHKLGLTEAVAQRSSNLIDFVTVSPEDAAVREIVTKGGDVDLRQLPILRFHELDGDHYLTSPIVARDSATGVYNASYHRLMYRSKNELSPCIAPFHLWRIFRTNESRGLSTPAAVILGHHPAFLLASAMRVPFEVDEYRVAGSLLGEPLRLVPSVMWGEDLLVPAEAEVILEGEILPGRMAPEGPFGEWTGYYAGQRQSQVFRVHAVTQRKRPIIVSVFTGHREQTVMSLGKEADILRRTRAAVPHVTGVALSPGSHSKHCYISMDKLTDGEPKLAALAAASVGFMKAVIVVDRDIDVFNESEVMWALAVRFQAHRDADLVRGHLGSMVDPSMDHPRTHTVVLIDATEPKDRPYPKRLRVPDEVMKRIRLEDYIPTQVAPEAD